MSFSVQLKTSAKEKWLDFCQANPAWITEFGKGKPNTSPTPDNGFRPNAAFILGVVSAFVPELGSMLPLFLILNPNADNVLKMLELDFDPEKELEKREQEKEKKIETPNLTSQSSSELSDTEYLDQIRAKIKAEQEKGNVS